MEFGQASVAAIPGPAPRPVPLLDDDSLTADDYGRLVRVVESVDHAVDLLEFRQRLADALRSWFGFLGVSVLHGETLNEALETGCGIQAGYSPQFLAGYRERWQSCDPLRAEPAMSRLLEVGVLRLSAVAAGSRFRTEYLTPHGITDKVGMAIDGGPAGVLFLSIAIRDAPAASAREVAVLQSLRRLLTPLVVGLLTRHRAQEALRAAWNLTPREWEVADLAAQGLTNRQIADRLFIGVHTVKKHLTRVLSEASCTSRTQLAVRYGSREAPG